MKHIYTAHGFERQKVRPVQNLKKVATVVSCYMISGLVMSNECWGWYSINASCCCTDIAACNSRTTLSSLTDASLSH
jgi:hypothetical protein